ncbi:MAG TPA: 50S ribosomal protein L9 [bacterium]|jgi:large subunit ribosomal protein L9|nr:50S ribosomal protein L9 [bacterium]
MKVILIEDIKTLGAAGAQVDVADGYARNYLIPRRMALGATPANARVFENEKKALAKKRDKEIALAQEFAAKLGALSLSIVRLAGEDDKLFGSVTNGDIAEALAKEGHTVDKRHIVLVEPLKALGIHEVQIHLGHEVRTTVKVWVVKQEAAS